MAEWKYETVISIHGIFKRYFWKSSSGAEEHKVSVFILLSDADLAKVLLKRGRVKLSVLQGWGRGIRGLLEYSQLFLALYFPRESKRGSDSTLCRTI